MQKKQTDAEERNEDARGKVTVEGESEQRHGDRQQTGRHLGSQEKIQAERREEHEGHQPLQRDPAEVNGPGGDGQEQHR